MHPVSNLVIGVIDCFPLRYSETVPTETSLVNNVGVTPVFKKLYNRDVMHCFIKRNIFTKHCLQYFMNGIK